MRISSAKVQAAIVLGLAALLWGAWALYGLPLRVRWLVAGGAPPAARKASAEAAERIRSLGVEARPVLLDLFCAPGPRSRKAWVASVLLRAPYFDQGEIEKGLASPDAATARAAAFALLDGEEADPSFEASASEAEAPAVPRKPSEKPGPAWDPSPAVPVLTAWLADRADPEARHAARLLGRVPAGDPRRREALLAMVEEAREILAPGAPPAMRLRKAALVDALQALLNEVRSDPSVAERVAKVVAWVEDQGLSEEGWDLEFYGLRLIELARGQGVPEGLLTRLAGNPNALVRQRLAGALEAVPGEEAAGILERLAGDEVAVVRRGASLALLKRKDPRVLRLAPWLLEDSYIYVRSDILKAVGEVRGADPEGARAAVPLLVACLEDPWPGQGPAPDTPQARMLEDGKAQVVEEAVLSLHRITRSSPGFEVGELEDWKKRAEICRALAADPARRKAVADEWRKTVAPWPPEKRIPPLVRRLGEADPENVVRAMRELARLTGDSTGFPPAALRPAGDDVEARDSVREWRKTPGFQTTLDHWKAKAGS